MPALATQFAERVKLALVRSFSRALPDALQLGVETCLYMSDVTILEPDLSIFPKMDTTKVRGPDVLLAIEVADASFEKDKGLKAAIYAKYGVQELWAIDAINLETHVHRDPIEGRWSKIEIFSPGDALTFKSAPGLVIKLRDL